MPYKTVWGRRLLTREVAQLPKEILNQATYQRIAGIVKQNKQIVCQRCGRTTQQQEAKLNEEDYYCPHCLLLGRNDTTQELWLFEQPSLFPRQIVFTWEQTLTTEQAKIAHRLTTQVTDHHLIWAVTGAGKTEILYPLLQLLLATGKRVAIASPRVDVCQELWLRFTAVFPEEKIILLHGKQQIPYAFSSFVICTTHQLYRFYHAFDLLVVDEIDAFPYVNDQGLRYATETAKKPEGQLIYLTATPDERLLKDIKRTFQIHYLPLRFHQRLLPEPRLIFWNNWRRCLNKRKKMEPLIKAIQKLVKKNHVLLFCPSIELMNELQMKLAEWLPTIKISSVSSKDEKRPEKVQAMRQQKYDVLLTTMILERGVTFENISVIVLGAEHEVFTKSSLVQIAGRADRKGEFSNSQVCFFYHEKTSAIKKAVKEIKRMNKAGKLLQ